MHVCVHCEFVNTHFHKLLGNTYSYLTKFGDKDDCLDLRSKVKVFFFSFPSGGEASARLSFIASTGGEALSVRAQCTFLLGS